MSTAAFLRFFEAIHFFLLFCKQGKQYSKGRKPLAVSGCQFKFFRSLSVDFYLLAFPRALDKRINSDSSRYRLQLIYVVKLSKYRRCQFCAHKSPSKSLTANVICINNRCLRNRPVSGLNKKIPGDPWKPTIMTSITLASCNLLLALMGWECLKGHFDENSITESHVSTSATAFICEQSVLFSHTKLVFQLQVIYVHQKWRLSTYFFCKCLLLVILLSIYLIA